MDYKRIIKSQKLRLKILSFTDFIPSSLMIKLQYKLATGRNLNLNQPERFTEKLQWYKLYYQDALMTQCADKYSVRDYINSKGFGDILVPLFGVYEDARDINFDILPDKFVLKTTNGSHTNILCEDKSKLDTAETIRTLNGWLSEKAEKAGREWAYYDIKPRIICEKYLEKDDNNDLVDYKFFCFNGIPVCLYVIVERFLKGGAKLGIYDLNFAKMPFIRADIAGITKAVKKPKNFDRMIEISKCLSEDFPHVRVDLYNIEGEIFFGELTFYDGSGYKGFIPDEFDKFLGGKFYLPEVMK
nr:ATP-grasp fold amidoligase family protein [uncultured Trichococcus sp.]